MKIVSNMITHTPLIKISDKIYGKWELGNPSGSIKDRIAKYIMDDAEKNGLIQKGGSLIEASSGNSGIAFSMLAAERGYISNIVMPSDMSSERKQLLKLFGANIIEVDESDFQGAIELADKLAIQNKWFNPKQFSNPLNIECHKKTTCVEIIEQCKEKNLTISCFLNGIGTGGTMMGVYQGLSEIQPNNLPKFVAMEPMESATLSGCISGKHGIQGIGDGAAYLLNIDILDDIIKISTKEAYTKMKQLMKTKGLFVGVTSAANILAAERWLEHNNPKGVVITILSDRGERYMSLLK